MRYEKQRLNFLEKQGYLEEEICITPEEYKKLSDSEKDGYAERTYDSEKGCGIEYVKFEKVDIDPTEEQFSNIMLLELCDKMTKCTKNVKTITEIMIFFMVLALISIAVSLITVLSFVS